MVRALLLMGVLLATQLRDATPYTRLGQIVNRIKKFQNTSLTEAERISLGHFVVQDIVDHIQAVDRMVNDHAAGFDEDLTSAVKALNQAANGLNTKFFELRTQMDNRLRHMERLLSHNVEKAFHASSNKMWEMQPQVQQKAYRFRLYFSLVFLIVACFPAFLYLYHRRLLEQEAKFKVDEVGHMNRTNSGRFL